MQINLSRTICSTHTPQCGKNVGACQKVNTECVWVMLTLSRKKNKVTVLRKNQIFMIENHCYVPNLYRLRRGNGE